MLHDKVNGPDSDDNKICSLMIDGISISDQIVYDGKERYRGFVDYGAGPIMPKSTDKRAKDELMFLTDGTRGHWKVPIVYFRINGIFDTAQCELIKIAINKLYDASIRCTAIIFDGHTTNKASLKYLGGSADPNKLVSKFQHPKDDKLNV